MEEVYEVRDKARRIAALLLLQPELDANYEAIKKSDLSMARDSVKDERRGWRIASRRSLDSRFFALRDRGFPRFEGSSAARPALTLQ